MGGSPPPSMRVVAVTPKTTSFICPPLMVQQLYSLPTMFDRLSLRGATLFALEHRVRWCLLSRLPENLPGKRTLRLPGRADLVVSGI